MENTRLTQFIETEEFANFSEGMLKFLSDLNSAVLDYIISSKNSIHIKSNRILNGLQKIGKESIYFGIEYVFYSDEIEEMQANCINVNSSLRESGSEKSIFFQFSIDSIYAEIDLCEFQYSDAEWRLFKTNSQQIEIETVKLVEEFLRNSDR